MFPQSFICHIQSLSQDLSMLNQPVSEILCHRICYFFIFVSYSEIIINCKHCFVLTNHFGNIQVLKYLAKKTEFAIHHILSSHLLDNYDSYRSNKESIWVRKKIYVWNFSYRNVPECAGECSFSSNLCKRALDVTADVIISSSSSTWRKPPTRTSRPQGQNEDPLQATSGLSLLPVITGLDDQPATSCKRLATGKTRTTQTMTPTQTDQDHVSCFKQLVHNCDDKSLYYMRRMTFLHCRSHTQCRYLNQKCKWGLSIKCSK